MDELEKLRKHWQDDDFQRKHALAREIVVNRLRELNREYEEKTGQGFVRFIETRMKTPESIAEKPNALQCLHCRYFDKTYKSPSLFFLHIPGSVPVAGLPQFLLPVHVFSENHHLASASGVFLIHP